MMKTVARVAVTAAGAWTTAFLLTTPRGEEIMERLDRALWPEWTRRRSGDHPPRGPKLAPGVYSCTERCGYAFELAPDGRWVGPYYPDRRPNSKAQTMTWEQLEDSYGDCAAYLERKA